MKKKVLLFFFIITISIIPHFVTNKAESNTGETRLKKGRPAVVDFDTIEVFEYKIRSLYDSMKLPDSIEYGIFRKAYIGYVNMYSRLKNRDVMTIIDYSKPSDKKRLLIMNIRDRKVLMHTYVAHGKKTGGRYASSFSNQPGSGQSSLGFFLTAETYAGRYGYSLRLDGLEQTNDNVRGRAIVVHGAQYVTVGYRKIHGKPGGSGGCPAVSNEESRGIIEMIKNGSCLFIYYHDSNYLNTSRYLNAGSALSRFTRKGDEGPR